MLEVEGGMRLWEVNEVEPKVMLSRLQSSTVNAELQLCLVRLTVDSPNMYA